MIIKIQNYYADKTYKEEFNFWAYSKNYFYYKKELKWFTLTYMLNKIRIENEATEKRKNVIHLISWVLLLCQFYFFGDWTKREMWYIIYL